MTSWAPGQLSVFAKGRCCWLTLHDGLRDNIVKEQKRKPKQTDSIPWHSAAAAVKLVPVCALAIFSLLQALL